MAFSRAPNSRDIGAGRPYLFGHVASPVSLPKTRPATPDQRRRHAAHRPSLTVSQIWVSVASSAAWATRERRCQSSHQSSSHRCNRVRNVAFRPQRRILWAGNLRVRQIAGRAWWHDLLRGESSLARRAGIRTPQCKGWRDGGSRANPVLQNVPARPPA
jgi:hypothetical protein